MLKINPSKQSEKFLKELPSKHARQLALKLLSLQQQPEPQDSSALKGKASLYRRVDVGEYRIIYRVVDEILEIILIGKRNDNHVYRMLDRLVS